MYKPEGNTALYDAIVACLAGIPEVSPQQQMLVVLSDGEDTCSHATLTECAAQIAQAHQRGVRIIFLGDGPEALMTATVLGIPEGCRYVFSARTGLHGMFDLLTTHTVKSLEHVATRGLLPEHFF